MEFLSCFLFLHKLIISPFGHKKESLQTKKYVPSQQYLFVLFTILFLKYS